MDVRTLEEQLRREGFRRVYFWEDAAYTDYPDHTHPTETAHLILDGEMRLTMNGRDVRYGPGERVDVPASAVHSARAGPHGCRYLIGEK